MQTFEYVHLRMVRNNRFDQEVGTRVTYTAHVCATDFAHIHVSAYERVDGGISALGSLDTRSQKSVTNLRSPMSPPTRPPVDRRSAGEPQRATERAFSGSSARVVYQRRAMRLQRSYMGC